MPNARLPPYNRCTQRGHLQAEAQLEAVHRYSSAKFSLGYILQGWAWPQQPPQLINLVSSSLPTKESHKATYNSPQIHNFKTISTHWNSDTIEIALWESQCAHKHPGEIIVIPSISSCVQTIAQMSYFWLRSAYGSRCIVSFAICLLAPIQHFQRFLKEKIMQALRLSACSLWAPLDASALLPPSNFLMWNGNVLETYRANSVIYVLIQLDALVLQCSWTG